MSEDRTSWQSESGRKRLLIFLLAWVVSASYLAVNLKRGWVPHDEGALAQSAERILQGELPHRDFDEPYTGGLSYLHALDFRLFGVNLISLRYGLFFFFVLWVPAVFAIAREFYSPWAAAGITVFAVAWSVPNYAASVPSWYCLFFATFGSLALLRYIRTPRAFWLLLAGLCGGLSCLMKTHGVLFVAGALLFLVYREQSLAAPQEPERQGQAWLSAEVATGRAIWSSAYSLFVLSCLALFAAAILRLLWHRLDLSEIVAFVVPPFAVVGVLVGRQLRPSATASVARFRQLFTLCFPFLAGFALPIAFFLGFFAAHHGSHDLVKDQFRRVSQQEAFVQLQPPHWIFVAPAAVLAALLSMRKRKDSGAASLAVSIFIAAILFLSAFRVTASYLVALYAAWCAIPVLSMVASFVVWKKSGARISERLFLLLAITVVCSLIQFPSAFPGYFLYVAPLVILCISALVSGLPDLKRIPLVVASIFFTLFAVFALRPTFIADMKSGYHADDQTTPLKQPRAGGLRVPAKTADDYERLMAFLSDHVSGRPILAGPDCPEVYFLSGIPNRTPILFEFAYEPREYRRIIEAVLDRPDFIQLVVINDDPQFSKAEKNVLHELVSWRFQQVGQFGKFVVFGRP